MTVGIETEYKFVLSNTQPVVDAIEAVAANGTKCRIEQYYLGDRTMRVRRTSNVVLSGPQDIVASSWVFTAKIPMTPGVTGVVEIEQELSEESYTMILDHAAISNTIRKTRYMIMQNDHSKWEIDVFYNRSGGIWLIMAECEVYDNSGPPLNIPPLIADNCVYAVENGDLMFMNSHMKQMETTAHPIYMAVNTN